MFYSQHLGYCTGAIPFTRGYDEQDECRPVHGHRPPLPAAARDRAHRAVAQPRRWHCAPAPAFILRIPVKQPSFAAECVLPKSARPWRAFRESRDLRAPMVSWPGCLVCLAASGSAASCHMHACSPCVVVEEVCGLNKYVKSRSDITPDPDGHRPQRPCAQGRGCDCGSRACAGMLRVEASFRGLSPKKRVPTVLLV